MSERYPYHFDRTISNAIGRLNTIGYRDDEQISHNEMVSDIRTIIDHIESLQAEIERLETRLSWAIQLTDDNNGAWSERLNAQIDAANKAAGESE